MGGLTFWSLFALSAFATWRLAHLVAREDGPADIAFRLRLAVCRSRIARAIDCFHCVAVWVAAPLSVVVADSPANWLAVWFGLAATASLADRLVVRRKPSFPGDPAHEPLRTQAGGDRPHGITGT
jgi:hypothetical protein